MNKKRSVPWIWSIIILSFLIIGGCGGGGIQPVQVPDLHNAQVLDALVTLMGQQTAPSQHTDPDHPLNLEGETAFAFEIQKRSNVAFTVSFLDQAIQPLDTGERLRYTLDLTQAPNGNHPIAITAANATPQRKATRSPVTIQLWIQVQHPYVTITVESIPMHSVQSRQEPTYGGLVRIGADSAFDITQTVEVEAGTELEIEAQAHEGYLFEGWYRSLEKVTDNPLHTINADTHKTFKARFIQETVPYLLSLHSQPPTAGTLTGEGEYPEGTQVQVSATANQGYTFMHWKQDDQVISTDASFLFTMPSEETTLVAVFERKPEPQAELPNVDLLWLEKDTATISLQWETVSQHPLLVGVYLRTQEDQGERIREVELIPNETIEILFESLTPGQSYQIGIRRPGEAHTQWLASFQTFHSFARGEGLQLFYWLDLTKPTTNMVDVKIFGNFMNIPMIQLDNLGYHTQGGFIRAQNIALEADSNLILEVSNDKRMIDILTDHPAEGYFCLSYSSDKGAIVSSNQVIEGYFGQDYLIASHEQLLYGPGRIIHQSFFKSQDPLFFQAYLSLMLPPGWESATGWKRVSAHLYQLPDVYRPYLGGFFQASHIYAYREILYEKKEILYGEHVFEIILSKYCAPGTFTDIQQIYDRLISIWGKVMEIIPKYTIIITEPPEKNPHFFTYSGEWTTGQGFSRNGEPVGQMIIHQMYHLWNGWALSLPWDHLEEYYWGFWCEGFNEFYCDKLLTETTFSTVIWDPHCCMRGWYQWYVDIRNTTDDLNLLTDELFGTLIHYWKGAVYAFAFDREIRNRTNDQYCLDDVLKHLWNQYEENGTPGSYSGILDYLRGVVPGGMDDWWQAYILNNEPMYLYQFEENFPSFSVQNPSPQTRADPVPVSTTLSWEVTNPQHTPLMFDLYLAPLHEQNQPMEPIFTGLNTPQKEVELEGGTAYIWRVKAYDSQGNYYMSPVWFFHTTYTTPRIALSFPENHANDLPVDLTLTWEATPITIEGIQDRTVQMVEYRVYLAKKDQPYPTPILTQDQSLPVELAYGTTYTWYVEGVQSDGIIGKSLEWQFSTQQQPSETYSIRVQAEIWDFFVENGVSFLVEFHDIQAYQKLQHIWVEGPGIGVPFDLVEFAWGAHNFHKYHWLEDRYQLMGGEEYTLRLVYDGLADEVIIVVVEDAQHHFVNILQPQDEQIFDAPQEIRVEWDRSHDRNIRDEWYDVRIVVGDWDDVFYTREIQEEDGRFWVLIPQEVWEMDETYRIIIRRYTRYDQNPYYIRFLATTLQIHIGTPIITMHDPNPDQGFHFPYFSFHNKKADKNLPVYILVFPNNSMPSNDLEDHIGHAVNHLNHRSRTFNALNIMGLIPVFPRLGYLYTHSLDHHTLKTEIPELVRVDLQLIAMIEDYRKILEDRGYTVAPKILIEGYSASGMFVNRFAMIHPEIIEAFSAGHCGGWPTLAISHHEGESVPYPLGIADLEELTGAPFDMEAFRQVPGFLYCGSADDNFHRDHDYMDLAIQILGEHAYEIWPNARIFYEAAELPLIEVRMYEGEDMDHTRNFGAATPDVIEFFRSVIE